MVDAVPHITTRVVRLDMKLGPYFGVMYPVPHLACRIKDSISWFNRDREEGIVNVLVKLQSQFKTTVKIPQQIHQWPMKRSLAVLALKCLLLSHSLYHYYLTAFHCDYS